MILRVHCKRYLLPINKNRFISDADKIIDLFERKRPTAGHPKRSLFDMKFQTGIYLFSSGLDKFANPFVAFVYPVPVAEPFG